MHTVLDRSCGSPGDIVTMPTGRRLSGASRGMPQLAGEGADMLLKVEQAMRREARASAKQLAEHISAIPRPCP